MRFFDRGEVFPPSCTLRLWGGTPTYLGVGLTLGAGRAKFADARLAVATLANTNRRKWAHRSV